MKISTSTRSAVPRTPALPAAMTAIAHDRYGEADTLAPVTIPMPSPGPRDVLIRVEAAALNPADVYLMRGRPRVLRLGVGLRRPKVPVRGSDVAGTVVAVGAEVSHWRGGDRVFGEARSGSLAEYALARADRIARLPGGVAATDAAASVMAALAARDGLAAAGLAPGADATGKRVLIIGASGGIGSFAIQLAKHAGAHVTAVCSGRNADAVRALGADAVVDYTRESVTDLPAWFDVIVDNVGAVRMDDLHALTSPTGVVLPNSGLPGPDGGPLMRVARANVRRRLLRRRFRTFLSLPSTPALEEIGAALQDGTLSPLIDGVLPLERGSEAMARVASGHARGKVVVTIT
ncbi:NAD(P)-dependent alcohol dehydrogenase [Demequina muriae]|uniref:NAD(P)-dependent alcohol dehydrogenase n=1 Tax=Demequina muriae TaxID=3051664 RepID=A0ABT8GH11_9MICO|nr:NAD(P)-dependent alcohol dehydrogenase [Demequina sp. EGI L300058]MDN4480639.1 NAD(P)-dependent alcohol dehydrogenase [Demequina sp. EGI L300058]